MTRVLVLNYEYPPLGGGASPVTAEIAEKYVDIGFDVDVVTMAFGDLPKHERKNGVSIFRVPCRRTSESSCTPFEMATFLPAGLIKSCELIRKHEYQFIHSHFIIPTGIISFILQKMYSIPYIITAHGSDVPGYNPDRLDHLHRFIKPVWGKILSSAYSITVPSRYLSTLIKETKPSISPEIIPHGIQYEEYSPNKEGEQFIFLTSRLFKRKGIQYVLDALPHCENNWEVIIAGDGPFRPQLEEKADGVSQEITFTGWISEDELIDYYNRAEIFIFPSTRESFGMVLLEAMSAGTSVITNDEEPMRDIIGESGITVDVTDEQALAKSIDKMISDGEMRTNLQNIGRSRVQQRYNWDRIVKEYVSVTPN
ncbi:glycosyltransferase family 4 protein [Halosimplex pelagicum]|uniref:Glycosyltransferase family 4 protein n=1 Tax=Halosimplex pelagicum TaxID=869886 RepID=A0A7D5P9N4_9EURY|nr:glycosyltransferase family 4 protein [Halosimplex pelagicum]QLH81265.1 glycosyltransferase family 4 protein [Halosimplex pelagicum]